MKKFESKPHNEIHDQEKEIMEHKINPKDRLQNQIVLAIDLFKKLNPATTIDDESTEDKNKIMIFWTEGEDSYSKAYRELENDPSFKSHSRLKGDIYKITADDVAYYLKNKELPKN